MNIVILVGVKDRLQIYFVRTNELKANRSKEMIGEKTTQKRARRRSFLLSEWDTGGSTEDRGARHGIPIVRHNIRARTMRRLQR